MFLVQLVHQEVQVQVDLPEHRAQQDLLVQVDQQDLPVQAVLLDHQELLGLPGHPELLVLPVQVAHLELLELLEHRVRKDHRVYQQVRCIILIYRQLPL
jgi:hypothetical protein